MLRKLLIFPLLLGLWGCPGGLNVQPVHAPIVIDNEAAAAKAFRLTRNAIDESYAILIATNRVIESNVSTGIWTKAQGQSHLNQSKKFRKSVDEAENALLLGNINDAKVRAAAIKALVLRLQIEVAQAARGE